MIQQSPDQEAIISDTESLHSKKYRKPGHTLLSCNSQDLTRRGAKKGKNQLLVVLPAELSIQKGFEGEMGMIVNAKSMNPTLVIKNQNGSVMKFAGRFVKTKATYFTIDCAPKSNQSVMSDLYRSVLYFDSPIISCASNQKDDSSTNIFESVDVKSFLEDTGQNQLAIDPCDINTNTNSDKRWNKEFGISAMVESQQTNKEINKAFQSEILSSSISKNVHSSVNLSFSTEAMQHKKRRWNSDAEDDDDDNDEESVSDDDDSKIADEGSNDSGYSEEDFEKRRAPSRRFSGREVKRYNYADLGDVEGSGEEDEMKSVEDSIQRDDEDGVGHDDDNDDDDGDDDDDDDYEDEDFSGRKRSSSWRKKQRSAIATTTVLGPGTQGKDYKNQIVDLT